MGQIRAQSQWDPWIVPAIKEANGWFIWKPEMSFASITDQEDVLLRGSKMCCLVQITHNEWISLSSFSSSFGGNWTQESLQKPQKFHGLCQTP